MHRSLWLAACLPIALLAGCADDAPASLVAPETPAPSPLAPETLRSSERFGWTGGVGAPAGPAAMVVTGNAATIEVPANASHLRVYVNWTCAGACDVRVALRAPGQAFTVEDAADPQARAAARAAGASPLVLEIEAPAPGEWTVAAWPSGPSVNTEGTFDSVVTQAAAGGAAGSAARAA